MAIRASLRREFEAVQTYVKDVFTMQNFETRSSSRLSRDAAVMKWHAPLANYVNELLQHPEMAVHINKTFTGVSGDIPPHVRKHVKRLRRHTRRPRFNQPAAVHTP